MVERKRRLVSGACICPLVELGELLPNTFFWPRVNWSSFFFFFPLVSPATFCGGGLGWKDPIWRRSNLRKMFSGREPQSLTPRRQGELLKMMLPGGLGCGCAAQSCCRDRTHQAACLGTRQCQLFGPSNQDACPCTLHSASLAGRKFQQTCKVSQIARHCNSRIDPSGFCVVYQFLHFIPEKAWNIYFLPD